MNKSQKRMLITGLVLGSIFLADFIYMFFFMDLLTPGKTPQELYETHCANCHGKKGEGLRMLYPPLDNADYLAENQEMLPCIIAFGLKGEIEVNGKGFKQDMMGMKQLGTKAITDIANYVGSSWGNDLKEWTVDEVKISLKGCPNGSGIEYMP